MNNVFQSSNNINPSNLLAFDRSFHTYDLYNNIQKIVFQDLFDSIQHRSCSSILDIGCGTGFFTHKIHDHFKSQKTLGIDRSSAMIQYANTHYKTSSLNFNTADAMNLPLDNSHHLIFSNACLQWLSSLDPFFYRLQQVISPDSVVACSLFLPETYQELATAIRAAVHQNLTIPAESFCDFDSITQLVHTYFPTFKLTKKTFQYEFSSLQELLRLIKFTGTKLSSSSWIMTKNRFQKIENLLMNKDGKIVMTYDYALLFSF